MSQSYKKWTSKCSKTRCKNENKKVSWEMDYVMLLIPYYKVRQENTSTSTNILVYFFFCFEVFWFFFFELNIFFKFNNNGIKYFTAECLFSAISQKRFVSSEVHLWDVRFFSILFVLFDLISSLGSICFQIYRRSL